MDIPSLELTEIYMRILEVYLLVEAAVLFWCYYVVCPCVIRALGCVGFTQVLSDFEVEAFDHFEWAGFGCLTFKRLEAIRPHPHSEQMVVWPLILLLQSTIVPPQGYGMYRPGNPPLAEALDVLQLSDIEQLLDDFVLQLHPNIIKGLLVRYPPGHTRPKKYELKLLDQAGFWYDRTILCIIEDYLPPQPILHQDVLLFIFADDDQYFLGQIRVPVYVIQDLHQNYYIQFALVFDI